MKRFLFVLMVAMFSPCVAWAVDYPIVVVVQKRPNDLALPTPEAGVPYNVPGDQDLMILNPDGSLSMLVDANGNEAVIDPCVSFDGKSVYYAKFHKTWLKAENQTTLIGGADIYRIDLATRVETRLTHGEFSTNDGTVPYSMINDGKGNFVKTPWLSYNTGPAELPDGTIAFTSTRNNYGRPKNPTDLVPQLYIMDRNGDNVEQTGFLNLMGAIHPVVLTDGRIMWSSHEGQGIRDNSEQGHRLWSLWASKPDGRTWEPLISAFTDAAIYHFHAQLSNGSLVCEEYYNGNNYGFGSLWRFNPAAKLLNGPPFGPPTFTNSPMPISASAFPFAPIGMTGLTTWAKGRDDKPADIDPATGKRVGKLTHPSGAPANDILAVWSNYKSCTKNNPPQEAPLATIVIIPHGEPTTGPAGLTVLKSDPKLNFYQPKALLPYSAIYGINQPKSIPFVPNDGEESARGLPAGTPFGLIGTSTFYKRDDAPAKNQFGQSASNWNDQGSIAGVADNSEIYSVRVLSMESRNWGDAQGGTNVAGKPISSFRSDAMERLRVVGEVPLRKYHDDGTPIMDVDGNPDTSFLAKIPADVPFTFQMLNADGQTLNMAQTWHQVRPGESRYDCGGCHAHSQVGTNFDVTEAAKDGYLIPDLTGKPTDTEWRTHVASIIQTNCTTACHNATTNAGGLNLATSAYTVFAAQTTPAPAWQYNSKYVKKFQSRVSLLSWKLLRRRTDGSTNAASTTDIDFNDNGCQAHTIADVDKRTIMRWIDLGCPISSQGSPSYSVTSPVTDNPWFDDNTKPTLALSSPRRQHVGAFNEITVGMFDHYSGLDMTKFSVKATFPVAGKPAGTELASLFTKDANWIWHLPVDQPVNAGNVTVQIKDNFGNIQKVSRTFQVTAITPPPPPVPDPALVKQLADAQAALAAATQSLTTAQTAATTASTNATDAATMAANAATDATDAEAAAQAAAQAAIDAAKIAKAAQAAADAAAQTAMNMDKAAMDAQAAADAAAQTAANAAKAVSDLQAQIAALQQQIAALQAKLNSP